MTLSEQAFNRHESIRSVVKFLEPNPNLKEPQFTISQLCAGLAAAVLQQIDDDSPEMTAGLRKLLEAKDCFVRASLDLNPENYTDRVEDFDYSTYDHDHGRCVDNRCNLKGVWHAHVEVAEADPTRKNAWAIAWCSYPKCLHRFKGQHGSVHEREPGVPTTDLSSD